LSLRLAEAPVDEEEFVADVNAIGEGCFMVVFAGDVLAEEAIGAVVWGWL